MSEPANKANVISTIIFTFGEQDMLVSAFQLVRDGPTGPLHILCENRDSPDAGVRVDIALPYDNAVKFCEGLRAWLGTPDEVT